MKRKKIQTLIVSAMIATMVSSNVMPTIQVLGATNTSSVSAQNVKQKRNVMYYSDWSIWGGQNNFYPKDLPADKLTHLNFAFLDFDREGNLVFTDRDASVGAPVGQDVQWGAANAGILIALQELREKNPNLKIGISVGGWSRSGDFSEVTANKEKRTNFVNNIIKFLEYTNMDYVDVDWEYPNFVREGDLVDLSGDEGTPNAKPEDKENYAVLLEELRVALDKKGVERDKTYELSIALPVGKDKIDLALDVDRIFNTIDFANVMNYDMRGAWENLSGHHTGLYPNENDTINNESGRLLSIDQTVDYLVNLGAEKDKLVIGAAYYTRGWDKVEKGDDAELPGLFQNAEKTGKDADQSPSYGAENELPIKLGDGGRAGGVWSYRNLDKLKAKFPGLKEYWDDKAKAPYLYDESTGKFFSYDNARSINEKTNYVNQNELGGIIGWQSSNDKPINGTSVRGELTTVSKRGLFGDAELPKYDIPYSKLDVTANIDTYTNQWGMVKNGYEITIKNNERAEEGSAVLRDVERGAETIKSPKLYIKTDRPLAVGDYKAGNVIYKDGYTIVDLKSVWEGKNIEQGQNYTFRLLGDAKIESIDLAQHMSESGPEMYRQSIYGNEAAKENRVPVLSGATDKSIIVGDSFDNMTGVSATDMEDGDLTSNIKIAGTVDTSKAGTYELTYSVTDSQGLEAVKTRKITVKEKVVQPEINEAPVLNGVTDKTIKAGDNFSSMDGVTARDKEDGDLTSNIKVAGTVDTSKAGTYELTYSVKDSKESETVAKRTVTVEAEINPPAEDINFGVGQGIEWPTQVNAPFADMTAWNEGEFSVNGALNLKKIMQDTGVKFFNLGFIQSTSGISNGKVNWSWGGFETLNEKNKDNTQYQGIKQAIKDVRDLGGDVTISLGGLNGRAIWEMTSDVDVLRNTYNEIIKGYGLTRIDLDIEGGASTNKASNEANAKALKKVQDETGVDVVLTLAVLPSGLTNLELGILEAYLSEGVDVKLVNIMTMCYGNGTLLPGENYGTASLRAVDSTKDQLKTHFKKYANIDLTDAEAYKKIGTTVSVGFEGEAHPMFPKEWTQLVVGHAVSRGIGMTSMWSINRDAMAQPNKGIYAPYEHTNLFKKFETGEEIPTPNAAPVLNGVEDKTINIGDNFNALDGVTVSDKEDGDLSSKVEVTGTVDTSKAGRYTLTYKVKDADGLTATKTIIITVKDSTVVEDTYDRNKIYYGGEIVIYKGEEYKAKWWTKGDEPDKSQPWEKIIKPNADGSINWYQGMTCVGGDRVLYNGQAYKAKWWTQSRPGSDDSWQLAN